ncbi:phosphoribulokinase [Bacillus spongiae]|uniref:Phosphoribulokinase n=1 Tax=Bacillus spongiae TaxID=2683610 RepID=A0ABU8HCA9_9BACI
MEKLLEEIISWVNRSNEQIIIGISGHGAAGKTTFSKRLVSLLNKNEVNYINTDPYIISSTVRKHTMIDYTYQNEHHHYKMTACHPAAHHLPSLERDVEMVKEGLDLYTINTHNRKRELVSSKNKITIVEGMSVGFINPKLFDLKIYFYTDGETELMRRSRRDIVERGTDINYLRHSHEERRIQYEVFMHQYSQHFDIVIKTTHEGIRFDKNSFEFNCKKTNTI